MTARASSALALRPYLPADAPLLAEIFRAAIEDLTADDYSPAQQEAWMASADDEEGFAAMLARHLTLVGTHGGSPVGFASMAENKTIDMLYVHPAIAGQGVATLLIDALEKLAGARGGKVLTVDASDTAREFFRKRGYEDQQRNTVTRGGEWFGNTTMTKALADEGSKS